MWFGARVWNDNGNARRPNPRRRPMPSLTIEKIAQSKPQNVVSTAVLRTKLTVDFQEFYSDIQEIVFDCQSCILITLGVIK